jgi:hypothetical protein
VSVCGYTVRLLDQQLLGGIPIYSSGAWISANTSSNGKMASVVRFPGQPNQAIIMADDQGVHMVAYGCGNIGGGGPSGGNCGSPAPGGGTFAGLYQELWHCPDVNARGDVLFLAEVDGGTSPLGLFLFDGSTHNVVKIVAVGDPSPLGGTIGNVCQGSINDQGQAVFAVQETSAYDSAIMVWDSGVLQTLVACGDPAPNGGAFTSVSLQPGGTGPSGFPFAGAGPPDILDDGRVYFLAVFTAPFLRRGIFEAANGQITLLVKQGDPAPRGGEFSQIEAPIVSEQGEVFFFSTRYVVGQAPDKYGWHRGFAGQWETLIEVGDVFLGQRANVGFSMPPYKPVDAAGNLIMLARLQDITTFAYRDALILIDRALGKHVLMAVGDSAPLGGLIAALPGGVSLTRTTRAGVVVDSPLAPVGGGSSHILFDLCVPPAASSYCTAKLNSAGCVPRISGTGIASASAPGGFLVEGEDFLNSKVGSLLYSVAGSAQTPFGGGFLCLRLPVKRTLPSFSGGTPPPVFDCTGTYSMDMNAFAANLLGGNPSQAISSPGATVYCQWWGRDPGFAPPHAVQLSAGLEYHVVP